MERNCGLKYICVRWGYNRDSRTSTNSHLSTTEKSATIFGGLSIHWLSSMAASLKWPLFFCPQGGLCGEVQLYFSSTWSLQHVRCLLVSGYLNWCLAQGIQIVECAMTLESGKIIRKRRGWRKRGGLELHGFVLTPYPIPLVFFLLTSPCKDSPQCERLEYARFIRGADQQKAATNICTIIKWKESKERA